MSGKIYLNRSRTQILSDYKLTYNGGSPYKIYIFINKQWDCISCLPNYTVLHGAVFHKYTELIELILSVPKHLIDGKYDFILSEAINSIPEIFSMILNCDKINIHYNDNAIIHQVIVKSSLDHLKILLMHKEFAGLLKYVFHVSTSYGNYDFLTYLLQTYDVCNLFDQNSLSATLSVVMDVICDCNLGSGIVRANMKREYSLEYRHILEKLVDMKSVSYDYSKYIPLNDNIDIIRILVKHDPQYYLSNIPKVIDDCLVTKMFNNIVYIIYELDIIEDKQIIFQRFVVSCKHAFGNKLIRFGKMHYPPMQDIAFFILLEDIKFCWAPDAIKRTKENKLREIYKTISTMSDDKNKRYRQMLKDIKINGIDNDKYRIPI